MYSIDEIRGNYKTFPDSKIEKIARNESKGLRKEILGILKEEIRSRNLNLNLISWIDAETNTLTDFEKQSIKRKIENLTCPNCGQRNSSLSGHQFNTIVSLVILTNELNQERIICTDCGWKEKLKSIIITLFAGWWSRRGILMTPYTIIKDTVNFFYRRQISERVISEFIEKNNGMFRLHGTDEENLSKLISLHNNDYDTVEINEKNMV